MATPIDDLKTKLGQTVAALNQADGQVRFHQQKGNEAQQKRVALGRLAEDLKDKIRDLQARMR